VFATVLVTSPYISLAFLFAPLIDFSWWRRLFGPGGVATAQQSV
jgi:hypothetical protein